MTRTLVLTALSAALAAGSAMPVPYQTPYSEARRQLIAQGLEPVRVLGRPNGASCKQFHAPCYPELLWCRPTVAGRICDGLYRRRIDRRYLVASWFSERPARGSFEPEFAGLSPLESSWLGRLDGFTIATANGRGKQYFCAHRQENVTPICSKASGTPCWVKPPADYRPARKWCD